MASIDTVNDLTPRVQYVAPVGQTTFDYTFPIFEGSDLVVLIDGVSTANFSVTGEGEDAGGTVVLDVACAGGEIVTIYRDIAITRDTDIQQNGPWNSSAYNDEQDKTYLIMQQLKDAISRALQLPITDQSSVDWASLLALESRKGMFFGYFNATTGAPELYSALPTGTLLTKSVIATLLNNTTTAEVTAGAVPVNFQYPPGYVDRYATNAVPGATDMAAAFNKAYAVAKQTGCSVRWGATAPYRLNSPINCTGMRGIVSWDESSKNLSAAAPSIIIAHDGQTYSHGFDLATSTEMVFNKVVAGNLAGKVPNSLFFMARNAVGSGAGIHRFNDCCTTFGSKFANVIYSYGSEENAYTDCNFYQHQNGSNVISHNSNNPAGYTSSFVTISNSTGLSNAGHVHRGSSYFNFGNSGSKNEVVFNLVNADNFKFRDGLWYCENGRSYILVSGATASNFLTLDSVRGEPSQGTKCTYAIDVQTTAATGANSLVKWTLNNVTADTISHFINFADTAELRDSTFNICSSTSGLLMNAYNLKNLTVNHGTSVIAGRSGGTVANCTFIGTRASVTLSGTNTANTGFDQANGRYWETGDSYTAASASCTGAITAAAVWSLVKYNKKVTLKLPAISATATATTNFNFGTVIPAEYRPAADFRVPCIILDNGASPNQLGYVYVFAATGQIRVYKDILSTANYTAAAAAGLPGVTEVSWTI